MKIKDEWVHLAAEEIEFGDPSAGHVARRVLSKICPLIAAEVISTLYDELGQRFEFWNEECQKHDDQQAHNCRNEIAHVFGIADKLRREMLEVDNA